MGRKKLWAILLSLLLVFGSACAETETPASNQGLGTEEEGLFAQSAMVIARAQGGFIFPVFHGSTSRGEWVFEDTTSFLGDDAMIIYGIASVSGVYSKTDERRFLEQNALEQRESNRIFEMAFTEIDGHPALLGVGPLIDANGVENTYGTLTYIRDSQAFMISCLSRKSFYDLTLEDMMSLAGYISYDESRAPIRSSQVALTIASENDRTTVSAGQRLQFTATFGDPELVNAKAKNDGIKWFVASEFSPETRIGTPSEDATISGWGVLRVNNNIDSVKTITIVAQSETYNTIDTMEIILLPKVSSVLVEPSAISLFVTEGAEETVSASLEPSSVPLADLTWTAAPKTIVEVEDRGNGTAILRPKKAGKATVTVKESGGKAATVKVTVKQPVESVELSVKGKAVPGITLAVNAAITPENASEKRLTWALDVDESIATISPRGQISISREAPVGQVITVTCTAEGAPQPVVETAEIVIAEE